MMRGTQLNLALFLKSNSNSTAGIILKGKATLKTPQVPELSPPHPEFQPEPWPGGPFGSSSCPSPLPEAGASARFMSGGEVGPQARSKVEGGWETVAGEGNPGQEAGELTSPCCQGSESLLAGHWM